VPPLPAPAPLPALLAGGFVAVEPAAADMVVPVPADGMAAPVFSPVELSPHPHNAAVTKQLAIQRCVVVFIGTRLDLVIRRGTKLASAEPTSSGSVVVLRPKHYARRAYTCNDGRVLDRTSFSRGERTNLRLQPTTSRILRAAVGERRAISSMQARELR
jgi:hypothetical protein